MATIMAGFKKMADERKAEIDAYRACFAEAQKLFRSRPEGWAERELITELMQLGNDREYAASAVDELRSTGQATKNWSTGWLSR